MNKNQTQTQVQHCTLYTINAHTSMQGLT